MSPDIQLNKLWLLLNPNRKPLACMFFSTIFVLYVAGNHHWFSLFNILPSVFFININLNHWTKCVDGFQFLPSESNKSTKNTGHHNNFGKLNLFWDIAIHLLDLMIARLDVYLESLISYLLWAGSWHEKKKMQTLCVAKWINSLLHLKGFGFITVIDYMLNEFLCADWTWSCIASPELSVI